MFDEGARIVAAAYQEAFPVGPNRFCVLTPLITLDGARLDPADFPNRGKIWWLVRHDLLPIQPGSLWITNVEPSRIADPNLPDKDRWQAIPSSIRRLGNDLIEVLDLDGELASPDEVASGTRFHAPVPPLPDVLVRIGGRVLGPFNALATEEDGTWRLEPKDTIKNTTRSLDAALLPQIAPVLDLDYETRDGNEPIARRVIPAAEFHRAEAKFRQMARVVDAVSNQQIVKWGLDQLGLTRTQKQSLKGLLEQVAGHDGKLDDLGLQRFRRFKELIARGVTTEEWAADVARHLSDLPAYHALFQANVERLAREAADRKAEELVREQKSRLAHVEEQRKALEEERGRLREENEGERTRIRQELTQEAETRRAAGERELGQRGARLDEREAALRSREQELSHVLEGVAREAREGRSELLARFLALRPLFEQLGLGGSGGGGAPDPRPAPATRPAPPAAPATPAPPPAQDESEAAFLERFHETVGRAGFHFAPSDLVNFHVCVKSGRLNVLAGLSGSGKSRLPELYARALGWRRNFLHVAVRPGWTDPSEFLGAFNAVLGRYEPGPSGLVDRIIASAQDHERGGGGITVVCLDEMNLARVEHYLSDFLSLLERDETDQVLELFPQALARPDDPYAPFHRLAIPPSLLFVGTVNIDETTHFFSPKVLDRVSVVLLEDPDLDRALPGAARDAAWEPAVAVPFGVFRKWRRPPAREPLPLLKELDHRLRTVGRGLGYRIRNAVLTYAGHARDLMPPGEALDRAILQRVLPGLRGSTEAFRETLRGLLELLPEPRFPRCHRKLSRMAESEFDVDFFQA